MVGTQLTAFAALALLLAGGPGRAQDEVVRALPPERIEKFLQGEKLEYKKSAIPKEDVYYFTFQRGKFEVRLTSFGGKDLMLDCMFKPLALDKINHWNINTKFSRASVQNDAKGESYSVLEYNLDLVGGITLDALRQYLTRFDEELKNYDTYSSGPLPDTKIISLASDDRLEKVLKDLNLKYQKQPGTGSTLFDFELDSKPVRLQSFSGKDLRLAARFPALSLEDINTYNLNRKFIRAINYKKDDAVLTALEAHMDCEPGVNEAMLRHFILSFAEDVRHFANFVQKHKKGATD